MRRMIPTCADQVVLATSAAAVARDDHAER
jgi:hypothetical protein